MMGNKPTKRRTQALETRNKIFNVALTLIEQKGFENITIEQISTKARVSVGAFYHHFSSKSDILLEIYKQGDAFFREKVVGELAGDTAADLILSYFDHFATFYLSVGVDHIKALFNTQSKLFLNKDRFMMTMLSDIVEQGKAGNELTDALSAEQIVDFLLSAARGLAYTWCLHDGRYPFKDALHCYMRFLLRALGPVPAPSICSI